MSKEDLLKRAEADLRASQDKMFEVALPLYRKFNPQDESKDKEIPSKKRLIKFVLDKLAEKRPNNETIVAQANQDLKETTEFVRNKNLVTVPSEPVKVIEMPEFARGSAVAYFDSAGPLEKRTKLFSRFRRRRKIGLTREKNRFIKEYNDYMLENLTSTKRCPDIICRLCTRTFQSPDDDSRHFPQRHIHEGWAVYAEQMMAEKGYGGAEVEMQQLKMKLRVIINAIIDQKIHTAGMTEKEAVDFMMNEGFQEEGEAVGKWKRAQLSSTQLSTYYVGSVEVNDLRRAYESKNKGKVDMKQMHDWMLSFGSPPAKYVREMLGL
jgi:hypothetical protein